MRKTKEQKGITLIALIITIVVLLILAVVAINSIQNDGIMSHAKNTANTYNKAVENEQQYLDNYLSYLDKVKDEVNGGSTSNPEGDSGDDSGSGSIDGTTYTVGQEVKVVKDGVEHAFYVIENSDETEENVLLLAKSSINTTTYIQESSNTIAFSSTNYWYTEGETIEYPKDLTELGIPNEDHYAAYAAYRYGAQFDGANGRLMTYEEADNLSKTDFSTKLFEQTFWLGRAKSDTSVHFVIGAGNLTASNYDNDYLVKVRPVIEISKAKLS